MGNFSKIYYDPSLTIKENAEKNSVSEAGIRYYIKVNNINRRLNRKENIIKDCKEYLEKYPDAKWDDVQKNTGHSLSTIRKYRDQILGKGPILSIKSDEILLNNDVPIEGTIVLNGKPFSIRSMRDIQQLITSCVKASKSYDKKSVKCSYVYLLKDSSFPSLLKIGKTNDIKKREKTLMGQKPTCSMYKYVATDSESFAYDLENQLHKRYKKYNTRGEWFELPDKELNELLNEFSWEDA